jgi:hypothetical protein
LPPAAATGANGCVSDFAIRASEFSALPSAATAATTTNRAGICHADSSLCAHRWSASSSSSAGIRGAVGVNPTALASGTAHTHDEAIVG